MKALKIVLLVVGLVLSLVILGLVAVTMLVDPNEFKPQIAQAVKEQTGRDLSFAGDLSFSIFPWLAIETGGIRLGNAPGFEGTFFKVDRVEAGVKIMPLLSKRLEMRRITLEGAEVNLSKNAQGVGNWEDLAGKGQAEGPKDQPREEDIQEGQTPGLEGFAIGGLSVVNANFTYDDKQSGQSFAVTGLNVETGELAPGKAVPVTMDVTLDMGAPQLTAEVAFSGQVQADPEAQTVNVAGMVFELDARGPGLPVRVGLAVKGDLASDQKAQRHEVTGMNTQLTVSEGPLPGAVTTVMNADLLADMGKQVVAVNNLDLSVLDLNLSGKLRAENLNAQHAYSGSLKLAEFNARKLMDTLGVELETADPDVFETLSASFDLSGSQKAFALENLNIGLDDTTVSGVVRVSDLSRQALRFNLLVDNIDADRYLPPKKEGAAPADGGQASQPETAPGQEPDVSPLRALDLVGELKVGALKANNLRLSDVLVKIAAQNGILKLQPFSANLYEGSVRADGVVDLTKAVVASSVKKTVKGVKLGPLLKDLADNEQLEGTANITANITTKGLSGDMVTRNLNGDAVFEITDGQINGVNIPKMIRDAKAKITGGATDPSDVKSTDFTAITGTAKITDGLVDNPDLLMKSPLLRMDGKGTADAPEQTIDYRLTVAVAATLEGQGGKGLADLTDIPIPLRISGTFSNPSYGLDTEALAKALLESKAKEAVEGAVGDAVKTGDPKGAVEGLKEGLGEGIKGLLPGGDKKSGDSGGSTDDTKDDTKSNPIEGLKKLF